MNPPPPPAEGLAARLFVLPALRTQPDRRLVTLVRDGYDTAFEEIVRRYGKALTRYAAAIVGGRSEDVTQDTFSKALLALRRDSEAEIDLKPWLYRIVRNTALNDLRDRPPDAAELTEALGAGSRSAAEEAERREEVAELMQRLRDLPEPQRAAIVMRELEGLSHDEIAAALGLSGGGARQTIYRARQALRDGLGLTIPLPLLRALIEHGAAAEATAGAAAAGAGGAAAALGGASAGAGAGTALKVGVVTVVLAGSVGTGLAIKENRGHDRNPDAAAAATVVVGESAAPLSAPSANGGSAADAANEGRAGEDGSGPTADGEGSGPVGGLGDGEGFEDDREPGSLPDGAGEGLDHGGPGPGGRGPGPAGSGHRGPRHPGDGSGPGGDGPEVRSGPGPGGDGSRSGPDGGGRGPGPGGEPLPPPPDAPIEGSPPPPDGSGDGSLDGREGSSGRGGGDDRTGEELP